MLASENFSQNDVELTTLSNYTYLLEQASESHYISEKELATLSEWRRDPQKLEKIII